MTSADILFLFAGVALAVAFSYLSNKVSSLWLKTFMTLLAVLFSFVALLNTIIANVYYGN